MPAVSPKQQRFMAMCAHNPGSAKGNCPPASVAKEFSHKPKGGYHKGASVHKGTLYAHKARHNIA